MTTVELAPRLTVAEAIAAARANVRIHPRRCLSCHPFQTHGLPTGFVSPDDEWFDPREAIDIPSVVFTHRPCRHAWSMSVRQISALVRELDPDSAVHDPGPVPDMPVPRLEFTSDQLLDLARKAGDTDTAAAATWFRILDEQLRAGAPLPEAWAPAVPRRRD